MAAMRVMRALGVVLLMAVGCGEDEPPPSCQQAFAHYYGAGCTYVDLTTGDPIPQGKMTADCQQLHAAAPTNCYAAFDAWLICLYSVPQGSTTNAECDCSREQMALFACR
jgi:hypothetical protein